VPHENDCGKTSLIDCLNILTHNKPVEIDDFSYGRNELKIGIETEDFVFEKKYVTEENTVLEQSFIAKLTNAYIERIKKLLMRKNMILLETMQRLRLGLHPIYIKKKYAGKCSILTLQSI